MDLVIDSVPDEGQGCNLVCSDGLTEAVRAAMGAVGNLEAGESDLASTDLLKVSCSWNLNTPRFVFNFFFFHKNL